MLDGTAFGCKARTKQFFFSSLHSTLSNLLYLTSAQRIFIFMFEQMCEDKSFAEYMYIEFISCARAPFMCIYIFIQFFSPHLIRYIARADVTHSVE